MLVVLSAVWARRVAVQGGQQHFPRQGLAALGDLPLVPENDLAGLLGEFFVQGRQQTLRGLFAAQSGDLVQRLAVHFQHLGQFLGAAVAGFHFLGQPALGGFDDPLLLLDVVGLLRERLLAFVQDAFPLAQFVAELAQLLLGFRLLLERLFLDFQLGGSQPIGGVLIGLGEDALRFGLGILAAQPVEGAKQRKSQPRGDQGRDDGNDDFGHGPLLGSRVRSVRRQVETSERRDGAGPVPEPRPRREAQRKSRAYTWFIDDGRTGAVDLPRPAKSNRPRKLPLIAENQFHFAEVQGPQPANPVPGSRSSVPTVLARRGCAPTRGTNGDHLQLQNQVWSQTPQKPQDHQDQVHESNRPPVNGWLKSLAGHCCWQAEPNHLPPSARCSRTAPGTRYVTFT